MSEPAPVNPLQDIVCAPWTAGGDDELSASPQKSFLRKAIHDTFSQFGARAGAAWITLLVLLAIGAPYLANTHPVLMKANGKWSSPMWTNLSATDIALTIIGVTFLFVWLWRRTSAARVV